MTAHHARELVPPQQGALGHAYARVRSAWRRMFTGGETAPAQTRSDMGVLARSRPVFFVTGLGKSGTRWLTRILDSHPEVLCKGGRFSPLAGCARISTPRTIVRSPSSLYYALTHSEHLRLWIERLCGAGMEIPTST